MKKWLIILLSLIILAWLAIAFFIPGKFLVVESLPVHASPNGVSRFLADESTWSSWWPDSTQSTPSGRLVSTLEMAHNGYNYRLTEILYRTINIRMNKDNRDFDSHLIVLPMDNHESALKWQCELNPGWNPLNRWRDYRLALGIKDELHSLLLSLQSFLAKPENIYGVPIIQTRVTDTVLIATKIITESQLTVQQVYHLISELRDYISNQHANQTGYPMLHSWHKDLSHEETMVAIPTDRRLKENSRFFLRLMVPGNILVTEVKGGYFTIHEGTRALENYISDYQKIKMAIPFESLVTERTIDSDTAQWVTKIYFPIMN